MAGCVEALVLAAGNGTRLGLNGLAYPKPLAPVAGQPLLRRILELASSAGVGRFVVVTGVFDPTIRAEFEREQRAGQVRFVFNPQHDLANGISALAAERFVADEFVLMMADHLFEPGSLRRLLGARPEPDGCILAVDRRVESCPDLEDATKVAIEGERIVAIDKNLSRFDALDTGMFRCSRQLFASLRAASRGGDCSLSQGMQHLASQGRLRACDIGAAEWLDVDTPEALRAAEALWPRLNAEITAKVR